MPTWHLHRALYSQLGRLGWAAVPALPMAWALHSGLQPTCWSHP